MPTAVIPALLRKFTGGAERVEVRGRNVREVIADLERKHPGLASHLLDGGELRPSIAVSIDGEIAIGGLFDTVSERSVVHFLPALGGG